MIDNLERCMFGETCFRAGGMQKGGKKAKRDRELMKQNINTNTRNGGPRDIFFSASNDSLALVAIKYEGKSFD